MSSRRRALPMWSFDFARTKQDAVDAAVCAASWLQDLVGMDLGHEGDHAADEALKNVRAVADFLRRRYRKGV